MRVPDRNDWGAIDESDLDAKCAFDQFYGKSADEAEAMFQRNALYYQEDLPSMPAVPFNFYAPQLARYITSERARGDADGASSFLHMVSRVLKTSRHTMYPETKSYFSTPQSALPVTKTSTMRTSEFLDASLTPWLKLQRKREAAPDSALEPKART
jgi:hypothetical protein